MLATQLSTAPDDLGVVRFADAEAGAVLDQLSNSQLVQAGAVNLIGLDAVRLRMGERCPRRREDVWLNLEKVIDRLLSDQAYIRRVSDTDFIVAIAGADGPVAQAMCLKVLTATLLQ